MIYKLENRKDEVYLIQLSGDTREHITNSGIPHSPFFHFVHVICSFQFLFYNDFFQNLSFFLSLLLNQAKYTINMHMNYSSNLFPVLPFSHSHFSKYSLSPLPSMSWLITQINEKNSGIRVRHRPV